MKGVIFVLFALLLLGCSAKKAQHTDEAKENECEVSCVDTIIIDHVAFNILTAVNVSCEDFDILFSGNDMKRDTIMNRDEIALLKGYLDHLVPFDSLATKAIDTRAKLFLKSSLGITEYCMNSGMVYSNGEFYKIPEELVNYIERLQK